MHGIIFIGLQASGKSTFYQQHFANTHIRLNLDMLKTRHRETLLLNACLAAKQPCVIDNTNPTRNERAKYLMSFANSGFVVHGYYFQSTLKHCLARNDLRNATARIPERGVLATHRKLELPNYAEGFDRLFYVTIMNNSFRIQEWQNEI